jgi:hypothetical protein
MRKSNRQRNESVLLERLFPVARKIDLSAMTDEFV